MTLMTAEKKVQFLEVLGRGASVAKACKAIGISRECAYRHRRTDEVFKSGWADAYEQGTDRLEDLALEVASMGNPTMLIFLLKARRKDIYGETTKHEHSGNVQVTVQSFARLAAPKVIEGDAEVVDE